jgi:hypothetical protein
LAEYPVATFMERIEGKMDPRVLFDRIAKGLPVRGRVRGLRRREIGGDGGGFKGGPRGMDGRTRRKLILFFLLYFLANFSFTHPLSAQEIARGRGEHQGFIINEAEQVLKVDSIKPGQTIQVVFAPHWTTEKGGKVKWSLLDQDKLRLRTGTQSQPDSDPVFLEWTSNSIPRPGAYFIHVQGMGGFSPGEILGEYTLRLLLWDQNDAGSGTDAPETYEKALLLPIAEPGTYVFDENFISGTADTYDIYKIFIKPNHSLTLRAQPLHWQGTSSKAKVRWEFLNKSFKRMKEGVSLFPQTSPFVIKVFAARKRTDTKPALFYLLVKAEGDVSMIYTLQAEMKEGR